MVPHAESHRVVGYLGFKDFEHYGGNSKDHHFRGGPNSLSEQARAFNVWWAYYPGIKNSIVMDLAVEAQRECHTALDLDLALDKVTSGHRTAHFVGNGREEIADGNSINDGAYAVARRLLEDDPSC